MNYNKVVTAEILLLLAVVIIVSPRGKAIYYTLLNQTRLADLSRESSPFVSAKGEPPATGVYRFTSAGLIVGALVATKTAKGAWGLFLVYVLAALLTTMFLLNYQQFLSFLTTQK